MHLTPPVVSTDFPMEGTVTHRRDLNCLFPQTHKQQTSRFGCSAVEAENVLIQIIFQMTKGHSSLVGAQQPTLHQSRHSVYHRQQVIPSPASLHSLNRFIPAHFGPQSDRIRTPFRTQSDTIQ